MKFPPSATLQEKEAAITRALKLLRLENLADAILGAPELPVGIPSEAHKRVSIATEIVSKPPVLFLDEPTSGLTADGALSVMTVIRDVCSAGHAVVSTIHQPSTEVFEMFDRILLLQRGGKTVYFGDLGEKSSQLLSYFAAAGGSPYIEGEVSF
jgi:ABC-type multidrug transport system ATPase subunit